MPKQPNYTTLEQICAEHTGKTSDKWHLYFHLYHNAFNPYREQNISLLEIGVQNGGSLEIWSKYFPKAQHLIGCDINPACAQLKYDSPNVHICIGDVNEPKTREQILAISPTFDIIIDDGSHHSRDIVRTFAHYFDQIKDGGLLFIEDLHCSYWANYLGGLNQHFSSINFLKNLADIVNYEHWRLPIDRASILQDYFQAFECPAPQHLDHIHSIEFANSVCIIKKRAPQENELGKLHVSGIVDQVSAHQHGWGDGITIDRIAPNQENQAGNLVSTFVENHILRQRLGEYENIRQKLEYENQQLRQRLQQHS